MVAVAEGHLLPVVGTQAILRQRRPTGVAAAVGRRLPAVAVAAGEVDDEAVGILAVERTEWARELALTLQPTAQSLQEIMLPEQVKQTVWVVAQAGHR